MQSASPSPKRCARCHALRARADLRKWRFELDLPAAVVGEEGEESAAAQLLLGSHHRLQEPRNCSAPVSSFATTSAGAPVISSTSDCTPPVAKSPIALRGVSSHGDFFIGAFAGVNAAKRCAPAALRLRLGEIIQPAAASKAELRPPRRKTSTRRSTKARTSKPGTSPLDPLVGWSRTRPWGRRADARASLTRARRRAGRRGFTL